MIRLVAGLFAHLTPIKKIILLALLAFFSMMFLMLCGWLIALVVFTDFFNLIDQLGNYENSQVIILMKYFQIINQVGLFIIPPLLFACFDGGNIAGYLKINRSPGFLVLLLSSAMVFSILPFVHWLSAMNELIRLPAWLESIEDWMRQSEENAKNITEAFINVNTIAGLIVNIIMIAILPAIGEELFFRGVLQKLFRQWFGSAHWAVLITAILFSAFHLQFYGFFPRFILGVMFGYLFVITNSLWVPILVHFVNNGAAVFAAFLHRRELLGGDYQEIGQVSNPLWVSGSIVISLLLFIVIYRISAIQRNTLS